MPALSLVEIPTKSESKTNNTKIKKVKDQNRFDFHVAINLRSWFYQIENDSRDQSPKTNKGTVVRSSEFNRT